MAGRVITVTSGKGGVGKTTVAGNLAVALARLGKSVVCLDLDIGLRNLDLVLGLENRVVYNIIDVIEGQVRLRQALVKHKMVDQLYLLPAAQWRDATAISVNQVKKLCAQLRTEFDFIIIDSPAGIEEGFRNAIAPADQVLIVATPEIPSLRDADRVSNLVQDGRDLQPLLIVNRLRQSLVKHGDVPDVLSIQNLMKIDLVGLIPEDAKVIADTNSGVPIVFSKQSTAGGAFGRIARRLLGEPVPFDIAEPESWTERLSSLLGIKD
jgi:septum site-determining protein MinD